LKPLATTAVALAATLSAGIAIADTAYSASPAAQRTIKLDATITSAKRSGRSALASGELRSPTTHNKVGSYLLDCVNIPPHNGECNITFALRDGHIAILASYGRGFSGNTTATDPIVGGTGAYQTARGFDNEIEAGENTMRFTLHLVH
jgi:hypothetical protein